VLDSVSHASEECLPARIPQLEGSRVICRAAKEEEEADQTYFLVTKRVRVQ